MICDNIIVVDEEHIGRLNQWTEQLREKRESVRGTALEEVLEKWCQLNQLLSDSLCTKHGLTPKQNTDSIEKEIILTEVTNNYYGILNECTYTLAATLC